MNLPELPEGYEWRVGRAPLFTSCAQVQLRRRWRLGPLTWTTNVDTVIPVLDPDENTTLDDEIEWGARLLLERWAFHERRKDEWRKLR